jgi:hypothetical protein
MSLVFQRSNGALRHEEARAVDHRARRRGEDLGRSCNRSPCAMCGATPPLRRRSAGSRAPRVWLQGLVETPVVGVSWLPAFRRGRRVCSNGGQPPSGPPVVRVETNPVGAVVESRNGESLIVRLVGRQRERRCEVKGHRCVFLHKMSRPRAALLSPSDRIAEWVELAGGNDPPHRLGADSDEGAQQRDEFQSERRDHRWTLIDRRGNVQSLSGARLHASIATK